MTSPGILCVQEEHHLMHVKMFAVAMAALCCGVVYSVPEPEAWHSNLSLSAPQPAKHPPLSIPKTFPLNWELVYIEFSGDNIKVLMNSDVLSISSQTRFRGTTARTSIPPPTNKLGIKGDWITSSSRRILWLPPEYRPSDWASKGNTIVIDSGTGRVTLMGYAATHSSSI